MDPNRTLALLVAEFGRSLIAVSELMLADLRDDVIEVAAKSSMQHTTSLVGPAFKKRSVTEQSRDEYRPVTARAASEIEFPPPQRPLDLSAAEDESFVVGKTARKILIALAQFGRPMTAEQIGFYAGLAHKGGSFQDTLRGLMSAGFIERTPPNFGPKHFRITEPGRKELGAYVELPQGSALFDFWCKKLGTTSEKILRALLPEPAGITMAALGDETGLAHKGGSFQDAVRGLRKMQLVMKHGAIVNLTTEFRRAVAPTIGVFDGKRTVKVDAHKGHVR